MNYYEKLIHSLDSLMNIDREFLGDVSNQRKILSKNITPLCVNWHNNSKTHDIDIFDEAISYCKDSPLIAQQIFDLKWLYEINKFFISNDTRILNDISEKMYELKEFYKSRMCFIASIQYYTSRGSVSNSSNYMHSFMKAHQNMPGSYVTPVFAGSRACVPFPKIYDNIHNAVTPKTSFNNEISFLISANNEYIFKFFESYITSFLTFRVGDKLHLHWIIDRESDYNDLDFLVQKYLSQFSWFSVSKEKCPDISDKRTYFACRRFLLADEILKNNQMIVITDIDITFTSSHETLIHEIGTHEIALKINNWDKKTSFLPWNRAIAGIVAIKNSYAGFLFLYLFKQQFSMHFCEMWRNWSLDQTILGSIINSQYGTFLPIGNLKTHSLFKVPWQIKAPHNMPK